MSDKPSYLGLLNAISLGECRAHQYLNAWIDVTPNPDVKAVLATVAAREGEHGMSFAKRVNELGFSVLDRDDPGFDKRMAIAASTKRSDVEKMEKLGFDRLDTGDRPDIFDDVFKDHSIDVRTGELLGRYIAEERDTARLLRCCYLQLKEAGETSSADGVGDRIDRLDARIDDLCRSVDAIRELVSAAAPVNGTRRGTSKAR
jgi:rubrerythrin